MTEPSPNPNCGKSVVRNVWQRFVLQVASCRSSGFSLLKIKGIYIDRQAQLLLLFAPPAVNAMGVDFQGVTLTSLSDARCNIED